MHQQIQQLARGAHEFTLAAEAARRIAMIPSAAG
jgi:hypothetical protein